MSDLAIKVQEQSDELMELMVKAIPMAEDNKWYVRIVNMRISETYPHVNWSNPVLK